MLFSAIFDVIFKYALRQCRLDEQMIYSNRLAKYMQCHDVNNFWKTINIRNKSKATLSNCIAGTSGETNIANMWKDLACLAERS